MKSLLINFLDGNQKALVLETVVQLFPSPAKLLKRPSSPFVLNNYLGHESSRKAFESNLFNWLNRPVTEFGEMLQIFLLFKPPKGSLQVGFGRRKIGILF